MKQRIIIFLLILGVFILGHFLLTEFVDYLDEDQKQDTTVTTEQLEQVSEAYKINKANQEAEVLLILQNLKLGHDKRIENSDIIALQKLSSSLKPFPIYAGDSLKKFNLSPGRAKLLLILLQLDLEDEDLGRILNNVDFTHADLKDANLSNSKLDGINLQHAFLDDAELRNCSLRKADLSFSSMTNIKMEGAVLDSSVFVEADLKWAKLSKSKGVNVIFDGARMDNAKLDSSVIKESSFRMSSMKSAILRAANFQGTNLWAANLQRADLEGVDIRYGLLKDANIKYANLNDIKLKTTAAVENWIEILKQSKVFGSDDLIAKYHVTTDSNKRYPVVRFYLNKKN